MSENQRVWVRCGSLGNRQSADVLQAATAILHKPIYCNFVTNLLYQFLVSFVVVSRRFSCKLETFNEKPLKCFLVEEYTALLRICT